ncbi:efflux RND transporter periplasmic adaptor subunit, partial [Massilia arenosa]
MESTPQPRASRRSRVVGGMIAVVAMIALGWFAWHLTHRDDAAGGSGGGAAGAQGARGGRGGGGFRGGPPTTVGVAWAERADLPVYIDALGTVVPAATATVRPQVSGVLQKVNFTEGQVVRAGQVLATIDPRSFEMTLQQAIGQRMRDEAQLESARVTLQRYRTLLAQDSIARQDVDTQAALVKQLEGTVTSDKAAEGQARLNLGYTQVRAPIAGRLGLRQADIGNLVGSNDTNGVAIITQMSPIDVEFAIPQDQVQAVQERLNSGAVLPAMALDRSRERVLDSGRFWALDNQVDTSTGTVRAKARFTNPAQQLFPSQFVNLRLQLNLIRGAVVVPVTALRHGADGDFVYVLNAPQRTVAIRKVVRGQGDAQRIEIRSGLQECEQVITEGADRLRDGAKVVLPGDRPQTGGAGSGRRGRGGQVGAGGAGGTSGAGGVAGAGGAGAAGSPTGERSADAAPVADGAATGGAGRGAGRNRSGARGGDAAGAAAGGPNAPASCRPGAAGASGAAAGPAGAAGAGDDPHAGRRGRAVDGAASDGTNSGAAPGAAGAAGGAEGGRRWTRGGAANAGDGSGGATGGGSQAGQG